MLRILSSTLLLTGCGAFSDPPWVGTYAVTSTWDISGPLANGRTVGDVLTDTLVGEIVGLTPVPGPLEEDAFDLVSSLIRDDVKGAVDASAPAALAPGGTLTVLLGDTLAAITVASTLELEEDLFGGVEGVERIKKLTYEYDGALRELLPSELQASGGDMEAEWVGDVEDERLDIEPHGVPMQYGELIFAIARNVLTEGELAALAADVEAAVSCTSIVDAILGGNTTLGLTIGDWSYGIEAATLTSACDAVRSLIGEKALGLFASDSDIILGGPLTADGDTLASRSGWGGVVPIGPETIAPAVTATLSGTRK